MDGGARRHVNLRTAGGTLLKAATIDSLQMTAHQVDDRRGCDTVVIGLSNCRVECRNNFYCSLARRSGCSSLITHTHATIVTGTEDFHGSKVCQALRCINQNVAAVLHHVALCIAGV